jgi:hypothetical protein
MLRSRCTKDGMGSPTMCGDVAHCFCCGCGSVLDCCCCCSCTEKKTKAAALLRRCGMKDACMMCRKVAHCCCCGCCSGSGFVVVGVVAPAIQKTRTKKLSTLLHKCGMKYRTATSDVCRYV